MRKLANGAYIVVGGQYGDECKGKVGAFLARNLENIEMICRAGVGPNAEHGVFIGEEYVKTNQLPLSCLFNTEAKIAIGPGTAVDPDKLFYEISKYGLKDRVVIDYRCPIIKREYIEWEKEHLQGESTCNGCGPCRSDFVLRKALQAKDVPELKRHLGDVPKEVNRACEKGIVLVESSQGTMLSLSLSPDYPHVTSKNVTSLAAADDLGLSWKHIQEVILCVKTLPTREANGPLHVPEFTLQEMKQHGLIEYSSINNEIRRKAKQIDMKALSFACSINGATQIALTFCDHFDPEIKNKNNGIATDKIRKLIEDVENAAPGATVTILETGRDYNSICWFGY